MCTNYESQHVMKVRTTPDTDKLCSCPVSIFCLQAFDNLYA